MCAAPFEIQLLGQRLVLKSEAEPELARAVVDLVSEKLATAQSRSRRNSPDQVALLALLDMAETHLRAKRRVAEHQKRVEEKSEQLLLFLAEDAG